MGIHHQAQHPAKGPQGPGGGGDPTGCHKDARNAYHAQESVVRSLCFACEIGGRELVPESRSVGKRTPTKFVVSPRRRSPLSANRHILNTPQYGYLHVTLTCLN